jgi:adenine/guanine/hypoxanthine permease
LECQKSAAGADPAGIVFGAIVTFILEKQLIKAAIAAAGGVLSWIGLLHAEQVNWAAAPQVALGYAMLAAVLAGIGLLQRKQATPPAADETEALVPAAADARTR